MDTYLFTLKTLEDAGALLMRLREEKFETTMKGGNPRDIVTSVDFAVNDFIISRIQESFPGHAIHSEESEVDITQSPYLWTIDPIDGSANFSRAIPHFAVCLGLLENGVPTVGGVFNPVTRELFSFKKDQGAFLNGKPIRVSNTTDLKDATNSFHTGRKPELWDWGAESYRNLLEHGKKTVNFGSTSLDTCFVASGRLDASIYGLMSTLDITPVLGILKEAGGMMLNSEGEPVTFDARPQKTYAVNNRELFEQLRSIV